MAERFLQVAYLVQPGEQRVYQAEVLKVPEGRLHLERAPTAAQTQVAAVALGAVADPKAAEH